MLCKQVRLSNIAKQQYLPFSIFSGVSSLYQLLRDALVSEFPGHKHLSANESQELCAFSQHLCNTKINLFSVWQCCSGDTEGPIQDPTLVAADPEKHRWSCCCNLSTQKKQMHEAQKWECAKRIKLQAKLSSQLIQICLHSTNLLRIVC